MTTEITRMEVDQIIRRFSAAATEKYGGYAYTAGYFESMVTSLLMKLSPEERASQILMLHSSSVWE